MPAKDRLEILFDGSRLKGDKQAELFERTDNQWLQLARGEGGRGSVIGRWCGVGITYGIYDVTCRCTSFASLSIADRHFTVSRRIMDSWHRSLSILRNMVSPTCECLGQYVSPETLMPVNATWACQGAVFPTLRLSVSSHIVALQSL